MALEYILRNRNRVLREVLDAQHGEALLDGEADGEARILEPGTMPDDNAFGNAKKFKMGLFPTSHRIVVYETRDRVFQKDRFAQLPYRDMARIRFHTGIENGKNVCCTAVFEAQPGSIYPSICFRMLISDMNANDSFRAFVKNILVVAREIRKPQKVEFVDTTTKQEYAAIQQSGLLEPKEKPSKR